MKSPVSYLSDAEYTALPLSERALHVAASLVGKGEIPEGSNWGPFVEALLRRAGLSAPAPWCAAFVYWCLLEAGADSRKLWKHPASTYYLWEWAKRTGRLRQTGAARGELFVWNGPGGGHCGLVISNGNAFRTIEGNTNDDGSREGYEVARRDRTVLGLSKYPRWGLIEIDGGLE